MIAYMYNKMLRLLEKPNLQEEFPKQCPWALPSLYLNRSCKKSGGGQGGGKVNKVVDLRKAACNRFLNLPEHPAVHFIFAHCPKNNLQETVNYNLLELGGVPC